MLKFEWVILPNPSEGGAFNVEIDNNFRNMQTTKNRYLLDRGFCSSPLLGRGVGGEELWGGFVFDSRSAVFIDRHQNLQIR